MGWFERKVGISIWELILMLPIIMLGISVLDFFFFLLLEASNLLLTIFSFLKALVLYILQLLFDSIK